MKLPHPMPARLGVDGPPVRSAEEARLAASTAPERASERIADGAGLAPAGCCAQVCVMGICHCVAESPLC